MNINMKYYIVTIGSIFLALGIGIIVGFNLNYDQELSKQQSEVLSEFEDRFDSLNQEKADLNTQIEDLTKEFVEDYIFPTIQAGAIYEGKYLLGTSFARPIIGKKLVEIALKEGADAICHGCTGKGNDQVRFELAVKHFAPDMDIIAPWRIWDIKSREEEIKYAEDHNIPLKITYETNYSKDKNLWHLSHEGLDLEYPENEPKYHKILELSNTLENAPDEATYISLTFEKGIAVALNGEKLSGVKLIEKLNDIGGKNAIGIIDMVENRLVGMKSRGVYETPGGTILYKAHKDLEELCLDKETAHYKEIIALKFAD